MESNFRDQEKYEASLSFVLGVFTEYVAPDLVITRVSAGAFKVKMPAKYARILTSYVGNGGSAPKVDDSRLKADGELDVTFTEPDETQSLKVSLTVTVPTTGYNDHVAHAGVAAPTLASLSVVTGTAAGGTSTTLTGTGYRAGARVKFGTGTTAAYATAVVVNSATSITCTTPAQLAGAKGCTVVNEDKKTGTKANAFTFT